MKCVIAQMRTGQGPAHVLFPLREFLMVATWSMFTPNRNLLFGTVSTPYYLLRLFYSFADAEQIDKILLMISMANKK